MERIAAEIYEKETAVGSDKCLILPAFTRLVAQLNLPNWKRILILTAMSMTEAGKKNVNAPTSNFTTPRAVVSPQYIGGFGLLSHPDAWAGKLGTHGFWAGGPMIPDGASGTQSRLITRSAPARDLAQNNLASSYGSWGNNVISPKGSTYLRLLRNGGQEETAYAQPFGLEVERGEGSIRAHYHQLSNSNMGMSDVTSSSLYDFYAQGNLSRSSSNTISQNPLQFMPTPYFTFSWPFVEADLRIHAWRVEVLETL